MAVLTKLTSKNQITLPRSVLARCPAAEYYDVSVENGRIVLTPVQLTHMDKVWDKLEALGLTEEDLDAAVQWGRGSAADRS
ncbi:hypothetical protein Ttaiw_01098 [Tepidimonas taiwanensis]|uniref:SpoVT-AbrB domain-containing protein n=1 Tax=Tepidimonas taiwanensis TaxID=307486 RepID=A0A554X9P9_9BURK|nr:hypothetical protein Ttaiw_01098 [Tepidimonas taiwanensis]